MDFLKSGLMGGAVGANASDGSVRGIFICWGRMMDDYNTGKKAQFHFAIMARKSCLDYDKVGRRGV